jgi:hypothetical protein
MTKTELLEHTRAAHSALTKALDGLTEEQATQIGLTSQWSVKDALAHITAWLASGAGQIRDVQNGTWTPQKWDQETIDRFNADATEQWRNHSMTQARAEFASAYNEMEQVISSLPDEIDESSVTYKLVRAVALKHFPHHAGQIEEWKQTRASD